MVATRRSLPNLAASDITAAGGDSKVPSELRRLRIDGKDTMRGEAREVKHERVYHYRGAVYAVTDATLPEWIEQQRPRFTRREEDEKKAKAEAASPDLVIPESAPPARGKKRKAASDAYDIPKVENVEEEGKRAGKRARTSIQDAEGVQGVQSARGGKTAQEPSSAHDEIGVQTAPVVSRKRKSTSDDAQASKKQRTHEKPAQEERTQQTQRTQRTRAEEKPPRFGFRREKESDVKDRMTAARKTAQKNGLVVDMLPDEALVSGGQQQQQHSPSPDRTKRHANSTDTREKPAKQSTGYQLARNILEMAHLNSRAATLSERYEKLKKRGVFDKLVQTARRKRMAGQESAAGSVGAGSEERTVDGRSDHTGAALPPSNDETQPSAPVSEREKQCFRHADAEQDRIDAERLLANQFQEDDDDIDGPATAADATTTEGPAAPPSRPSPCRDDAALDAPAHAVPASCTRTLTPLDSTTPRGSPAPRLHDSTTAVAADTPPKTTTPLSTPSRPTPDVSASPSSREDRDTEDPSARPSAPLRWSAGPIPALSRNLHSDDHAEHLIHRGRMDGESRQARRRRIRRELKILQSMPLVTPEDDEDVRKILESER